MIVARKRHRLAQRRKAVGLSQEGLAEVVGVDRSTVVRWERADTEPQPWHRPKLARALKVSVEELAALLADVGEAPVRPNERLDYVLKHPGSVDLVAAAFLREQLQRLDEQYDHMPSTLLLAEAGQLYGQTVFLREHAGSLVRRELLAAEVESAILMGQLVWDASQRRDHDTAITSLTRQSRPLVRGAMRSVKPTLSCARAMSRCMGPAVRRTAWRWRIGPQSPPSTTATSSLGWPCCTSVRRTPCWAMEAVAMTPSARPRTILRASDPMIPPVFCSRPATIAAWPDPGPCWDSTAQR
jgi:transcriptional regulator with XRE-family HTH domain